MKKLQALTEVFDGLTTTDKDLFDSWAEQGELEWSGSIISTYDSSMILWRQKYLAVFSFESYTAEPDQLFLTLMTWLKENDCDRDELGQPEFDVEKVDDHTFDVEISIWFEDKVYGKKTGNGYSIIENPEITTAEEVAAVTSGIDCQ